jgi:hypothetical protein
MQQPAQAAFPVLVVMRVILMAVIAIVMLMPAAAPVLVVMRMAVPVTVPVLVEMAVVVEMAVLAAVSMQVLVARGGHFIHASILREEMRFRTSTTTSRAHMRKGRNNPGIPAGHSPLCLGAGPHALITARSAFGLIVVCS